MIQSRVLIGCDSQCLQPLYTKVTMSVQDNIKIYVYQESMYQKSKTQQGLLILEKKLDEYIV